MKEAVSSEQLWRLTLESSPVGMALVAPDGLLLAVNQALCEMLGYEAEVLCTMTFQEITHPEDLDRDLALVHETLAGERTSYRIRKRYLRADGPVVWGDLSVSLLRDEDGTPIHFISQILDVTAEQEYAARLAATSRALDHHRSRLEAVFDAVDVALVVLDRDGHSEMVNRRHLGLIELANPDPHRSSTGIYAADGSTLLTFDELPSTRAAAGEQFDDLRVWVGSDSRTRRALSVSARPVRGADGELFGAVMAATDVTDYARAIAVKDEFVAHVSHELRTPLTSILGYLELVIDSPELSEHTGELLQVVERNAVRLHDLVADLLLMGQMTDGLPPLNRAHVDLCDLARDAVLAAELQASRRDIGLVGRVPDQPLVSRVDGPRLRQVVDNLLSNAIKYSDAAGTITLALSRDADTVELAVSDTGPGIAPDELEQLFTRFFRGGRARAQMLPGAGLGLSIVRSIVEAHGGEVRIESALGVGSCFRVLLPHEP